MRAREVPHPLVTRELLKGLDRAEGCRRDALVRDIEADLMEVDEVAYYRRAYRRARGREVEADTSSLLSGERDEATVLFLDIQGSTEFARGQDPEVFMMTLNQMMATFAKVLEGYRAPPAVDQPSVKLSKSLVALGRRVRRLHQQVAQSRRDPPLLIPRNRCLPAEECSTGSKPT
jgi:hypothetical protein